MRVERPHIVQTICFDVQAPDEVLAREFTILAKQVDVEHLLQTIFDKYEIMGRTIRIDRVEIDAGNLLTTDIALLEERIREQLEAALQGHAQEAIGLRQYDRLLSGYDQAKASLILANTDMPLLLDPLQDTAMQQSEWIIHYLLTGQLPWQQASARPDLRQFFKELAESPSPAFIRMLHIALAQAPARERLLQLLQVTDAEKLIPQLLSPGIKDLYEDAWQLLSVAGFTLVSQEAFTRLILQKGIGTAVDEPVFLKIIKNWLGNFFATATSTQQEQLVLAAKQHIEYSDTVAVKELYRYVGEMGQSPITSGRINTDESLQQETTAPETLLTQDADVRKNQVGAAVVSTIDEDKANDTTDDWESGFLKEETEVQEHYFVTNSGLILLNAGLLKRGFETLGWVAEDKIVNDNARNKMLLWMHYLVWGEDRAYEYDWQLNKVLTGMLPEMVADINISISAFEKAEADHLLDAVTEYWTALKGVSRDGLRQTFLQRNGRLSCDDSGWQLHVETKGVDILIDYLPWPFSIVKFPWMTKPLFTQWSTKI
jgi:hypothetical protein